MKTLLASGSLVIFLLITGCASYLTVPPSNAKLREDGAVYVHLGDGGHKIVPFFAFLPHTFEPEYIHFNYGTNFQVQILTTLFEASDTTKAIEPSLKYAPTTLTVPAQISAGISQSKRVAGRYVIATFPNNFLIPMLNDPSNEEALQALWKNGTKARVITAVAIAYSFTNNELFSANIGVSGTYDKLTGSLNVTNADNNIYTLSDGTIFAYRMAHICWGLNENNQRIVGDLVDDNPGIQDESCPLTLTDNPTNQMILRIK